MAMAAPIDGDNLIPAPASQSQSQTARDAGRDPPSANREPIAASRFTVHAKRFTLSAAPFSLAVANLAPANGPAMRRPRTDRLHLPADMHYDCVQCGHGCMDPWEIAVDPESEGRMATHDLKAHQQRAKDRDPIGPSSWGGAERTLCREGHACTFLRDDKRCALHAALGPKEKPQTCIDFPFRYVDTPVGAFVGVSFVCTAVLRDHGDAIEAKRAYLDEGFSESVHVEKSAVRPQLTPRIAIDFDAYLALEAALDDILRIPNAPLPRRLLVQSLFLDIVVETFAAARLAEDGRVALNAEERAAAQSASDADLVRALAARCRADNWGRLLASAVRRRPFPMVHRAFVGLLLALRGAMAERRNRIAAMLVPARFYLAHALMAGTVRLPPLDRTLSFAELKRLWPDPADPEFDALLTRYFRHALFRKDLLGAESIRAAHRQMLYHFALVGWYTATEAAARSLARPDIEALREGLRSVEKYYVLHTTFGEFLQRQPVLGTMLDTVMAGRTYAETMTAPPFK